MSGRQRSLESIASTVERWVAARWPERRGLRARDLRRASTGYSNETVFVSVGAEAWVLRLPPLSASFPDRDPLAEGRLLASLASAGLPVPAPVAIEEDPAWFGAPFVVLPRVEGRAPGEVLAFDEWLVGGGEPLQAALHEAFVGALASIHRLDWPADGPGLGAEVDRWCRYLDWAADGSPDPLLADAMAWVASNQPAVADQPPSSLTWGDARMGNLLVDEGTAAVVAILDWELAAVGPAELDLGWHLALDELQARFVGSTLPGFPDRDGTLAAWEAAAGRPAVDVAWHEVFALVRSTAIHDHQSRLAVAAGDQPAYVSGTDNPLVRWLTKKIERM